jgi:hypothetical protein
MQRPAEVTSFLRRCNEITYAGGCAGVRTCAKCAKMGLIIPWLGVQIPPGPPLLRSLNRNSMRCARWRSILFMHSQLPGSYFCGIHFGTQKVPGNQPATWPRFHLARAPQPKHYALAANHQRKTSSPSSHPAAESASMSLRWAASDLSDVILHVPTRDKQKVDRQLAPERQRLLCRVFVSSCAGLLSLSRPEALFGSRPQHSLSYVVIAGPLLPTRCRFDHDHLSPPLPFLTLCDSIGDHLAG